MPDTPTVLIIRTLLVYEISLSCSGYIPNSFTSSSNIYGTNFIGEGSHLQTRSYSTICNLRRYLFLVMFSQYLYTRSPYNRPSCTPTRRMALHFLLWILERDESTICCHFSARIKLSSQTLHQPLWRTHKKLQLLQRQASERKSISTKSSDRRCRDGGELKGDYVVCIFFCFSVIDILTLNQGVLIEFVSCAEVAESRQQRSNKLLATAMSAIKSSFWSPMYSISKSIQSLVYL